MKCPACSKSLTSVPAGSVTLDVCSNSCGGIWFDKKELEKFDQQSEAIADKIMRAVPNSMAVIDRARQRYCPKCASAPLSKRFHDTQYKIEVDECDSCDGVWLDIGELKALRDQNKTSADRQQVIDEYFVKHFKGATPSKGVAAVIKLLF